MIWNNLCRYAGPGRNAEAPIERENKPNDGHNHGRLPNPLGLLPLVDSFATGDRLERDRCFGQFPKRRCVSSFRPQRKSRTK